MIRTHTLMVSPLILPLLVLVLMLLLPAAPLTAQAVNATKAEVNAFVGADRNKDGMLTRKEFRSFVRAMAKAGQSTAKTIVTFGAYGYAFRRVDANRDGLASPAELRGADEAYKRE
ncbi:EF-hand domain-containing protein [Vannielia litorea]|nr:EF-hand domain-containing protein [Vannielia litorea]